MEVIKNGIKYYFKNNKNIIDEKLYFRINWQSIEAVPKNQIELKKNCKLAKIKEFKKYYNCKYNT